MIASTSPPAMAFTNCAGCDIDQSYILHVYAIQSEKPAEIEFVNCLKRNADSLPFKVRNVLDSPVFPPDDIIILEFVVAGNYPNSALSGIPL